MVILVVSGSRRIKRKPGRGLRFAPAGVQRSGSVMPFPGSDVPAGRYRHFKGGLYEVLGVARHSETEEELVVYRPLDGEGGLWVRPKRMFLEPVILEGQAVPRFRHLGPGAEGAEQGQEGCP